MKRYLVRLLSSALLLTGMGFIRSGDSLPGWSASFPAQQDQPTPTPGELIDGVNALRLAYGLPPLTVNSILMRVAQTQANYLVETDGGAGHERANGMSLTEELLFLGYPLAGDLSLGGYRAENWANQRNMDVQSVIHAWLGDELHTNTMLSPNYNDIGGGVAIDNDNIVYFVLDTARHTASGKQQDDYTPAAAKTMLSQNYTPAAAGTTVTGIIVNGTPGADQFMVPVALSTPNSSGLVIHEVKYGQSLWSIAITYGTTILQIQNLNNLPSNDIFPGQKLLIRKESAQTPAASSAIYTPTFVPATLSYPARSVTPAPLFPGSDPNKDNPSLIAVTILVALSFAGFGFWANKGRG